MSSQQQTKSQFYDQAALDLFKRLNIDEKQRTSGTYSSMYHDLDPIWSHPVARGTIFVGNQNAASSLEMLKGKGITHVVNCTNGFGSLPNYHEGKLRYYRFSVSDWRSQVTTHPASAIAFTQELWQFVDGAIEKGENVLVHCLAGAHRAGTTGCACLIHYARLNPEQAIATAKKLRPIIDPICDFPTFLNRVFEGEKEMGNIK